MDIKHREDTILGLGFQEKKLSQLKSYLDLLWSSNEELNLISRKMTQSDLLDNHVIDCLLGLPFFPMGINQVSDFGSGGGLPGVLYAIQFPDIQFTLYEKSKLKQSFLRKCQEIAPNLRVEADIPIRLAKTDLITARAFKPLDVILQMSLEYYKSGGRYFLLKGRREKIEEEIQDSRRKVKDFNCRVEALKSPVLEVERHLVLINT